MTEIARKKINEAIKNKSNSLNLGKCGLETIPDEVLEMTWLEELIMSNRIWDKKNRTWLDEKNGEINRIKFLPNNINKLSNLSALRICGDLKYGTFNIENVEVLKNLTQLNSLSISNNRNIKDFSFLKNLTQLNSLDISYNIFSDTSFLKNLTQLNSLSISNNRNIKEFSFLKNLTQLNSLDISYNNISDTSFLKNLTQLNSLSISNNIFSDTSFLEYLTQLNSLDISYNRISNTSFLKNLTRLNSLDIHHNKNIKDFSFLKNLSQLNSLDISHNRNIKDFSFLKNLTQLNSLNIGNNIFSDISFLKNLTQLNSLDIRDNIFSDTSFLENLSQLNSLDISHNRNIKDFSFLKNLSQLNSLDISHNYISNISFLKNLSQLNSLNISHNIFSDTSFLENLTQLNSLNISHNIFSDTSFLENLSQLNSLDISYNRISNTSFLKYSTQLNSLCISDNRNIKDFSFLKYLTQLNSLDISSNNLSDTSFLKYLTQLNSLDIGYNRLEDFEDFLPMIRRGNPIKLEQDYFRFGIYINNNPWSSPPKELLQQGIHAVLDYFSNLKEQGKAHLYEAKMIIVGKGGAGKTSLIKKLLNRTSELPKEEETTKGVDIERLKFIIDDGKEFTANIWDFGGQEIYHSTHKFFLTERSLYVLVDDTRDDDKSVNDAKFKFWLQTVELFGNGSPLLIFQNEKGGRSKDLDMKSMKSQFEFIQDKYADDLKFPDKGLSYFEKALKFYIQNLPHIGKVLPKQWVKIREELLQYSIENPYITLEKYYSVCKIHEINDQFTMLNLSKYLHDIGTFLHFQDDDLLRKTIILQNEWATDAVYKVLDNENIKKQYGEFSKKMTSQIWKESRYIDMHPELLSLMLKFELCYKLEDKKDTYLIPQLLPESRPDNIGWDNSKNLQLKYVYAFMPRGLLSRFLVRNNRYLANLSKSWKKGMILEREDVWAFIEEKYGLNEINIRLRGTNKKDFLIILVEEFDKLNNSYEGIKVEKLIPCNCTSCSQSYNPHFYKYDDIIKRNKLRKATVECTKEPFENVSIVSLIDPFLISAMDDIFGSPSHHSKEEYYNFYSENVNVYSKGDDYSSMTKVEVGNQSTETNINVDTKKTEPPLDEKHTREVSIFNKWWVGRIAGAFAGGVLASIFGSWFNLGHPFSAFLIIFSILAAFLFYLGNPERRFFRAAFAAFGAAVSAILLQLGFSFKWTQKIEDGNIKLVLEWLTEYEWLISICLLSLSAFLFWLDWKKDNKSK